MTAGEHRAAAERLLATWERTVKDLPEDLDHLSPATRALAERTRVWGPQFLAAAQVHATLALTAWGGP